MRDEASACAERRWADLAALPAIHNAVVRVIDAKGHRLFDATHGEARPGVAMTLAHRFHIASVAKPMTATLILQLAEEGAFGAAGIDAHYCAFDVFEPEIMARLHRRDGVSAAGEITLRHFLTHTSGIRDAMEDDAGQIGGPAPGSLIGRMQSPSGDPSRFWAPWAPNQPDDPEAGVINFFLGTGIADAALAAPGARFHYSDTGFMLLGLLIEKILGQPLGEALFQRIVAPLGLRDTYLAYRCDPLELGPKREPEADFWSGALPLFESGVSLSFDWAGGGVVSSASSLNVFLRALLAGELFTSHATLQEMLAWSRPSGLAAPRTGVGLGIFRTEFEGIEFIGHSGASGAKMFYAPRHDFFLSGTINQSAGPAAWHWPIARCFAEPADEEAFP
jgi:D-alanyl-D-alanine carboxypeptidase